eukprot:1185901-Prorocentrum_minimum.AAC.10
MEMALPLCWYLGGAATHVRYGNERKIPSGWKALHMAANHGHAAVVEALLSAGARADDLTEGNTVLHHLFMEHNLNRLRFSGALLNTLEQMVTAGGANLNKKNRRGEITWKA